MKIIKEKRLGKFKIIFNQFFHPESSKVLMAILKKMIVIKADHNAEDGTIEYAAYSEIFEPIMAEESSGEILIPYYSLVVGKVDPEKKCSRYKILSVDKLDDDEVLE